MRLILMGPPGSGKGTFAKVLSKEYAIPHLSTGQMVRREIQTQSELGKLADLYAKRGHLVEDSLMLQIVEARLRQGDVMGGFIFDGFPRTLSQATGLQKLLRQHDQGLTLVVGLTVAEAIRDQRACHSHEVGAVGMDYAQAKAQFEQFAEPVQRFYRQLGLFVEVDVSGTLEENVEKIKSQILKFRHPDAANGNIPERKIYSV